MCSQNITCILPSDEGDPCCYGEKVITIFSIPKGTSNSYLEVGNVGLYNNLLSKMEPSLTSCPHFAPTFSLTALGRGSYVFNFSYSRFMICMSTNLMYWANTFPLLSFCMVILERQYSSNIRDLCRFRIWKLFF